MQRSATALPLTHHEILGLVGPFTRRGRHVDLGASDRAARLLAFKPAASALPPAWRETLHMACAEPGHFVLTRTLIHPAGPQATLRVEGPEPAALLEQLDRVAPHQQFTSEAGYTIARSHAIDLREADRPGERPAPPPILLQGVVQVDGLTLTMDVGPVTGIAADIALRPAAGMTAELPEDLLAVLGWDWTRLERVESGWSSRLRLRGSGPRRTRTAEAALERAARHLAQVLGEAPARFHERHRLARWGAMFRRSIPSLTAVSMIAAAAAMPHVANRDQAGILLALHYVPIAALALAFSLQEMAQFEIPRPPRRSKAARWLEPAAADVSASAWQGDPESKR